ncbi:hypothetical protein IJV79_04405, partial [bacterium]|nr:hypothetical protein [bacterium]
KATKSSGSVLKKIAKGGKVALIATGIATIASGIFKLYNANKAQLSANGQPNVAGSPAMTMVTPQAPVQEFTSESA